MIILRHGCRHFEVAFPCIRKRHIKSAKLRLLEITAEVRVENCLIIEFFTIGLWLNTSE